MIQNPPTSAGDAGDEGWISSGEDPLEEEMTTHSSILVWIIPWGALQATHSPWDSKESDTTEWLNIQNNVICNCTYNGNCYNYHWGGQGEWGRLSSAQIVLGMQVLKAQIQKQPRGGARLHRWLQDARSWMRGRELGDGLSAIPGDSRAGPLQGWWA